MSYIYIYMADVWQKARVVYLYIFGTRFLDYELLNYENPKLLRTKNSSLQPMVHICIINYFYLLNHRP